LYVETVIKEAREITAVRVASVPLKALGAMVNAATSELERTEGAERGAAY
jgi:hypothetical protein